MLEQYIYKDIKQINKMIQSSVGDNSSIVQRTANDLLNAGGKKVRPIFTLLAGKLGDENNYNDVLKVATSLELMHMATLIHDDIIDKSASRRGKPTIYYQKGYFQAINAGSYLFSTALKLVSTIHSDAFHHEYSEAIFNIVNGELIQFDQQYNAELSINEYMDKTYRKTGLLIELSVKLGSIAGGLNTSTTQLLTKYAYHIGLSYQIIDDCLDFIGDEKTLGKPKFSDLKNGHYTLPILLLRDQSEKFKHLLFEYSDSKTNDERLIPEILNSNTIDQSINIANNHMKMGLSAIENIEEPIRSHLIEIANRLSNRLN